MAGIWNTHELRTWVTHCKACGHYGVHPDIPWAELKPGTLFSIRIDGLKTMAVNENGLCEQCTTALERLEKSP